MEDRKENRLKELQNLRNCAEITDKKINEMIVSVGWNIASTKNSKIVLECPFDSSHHLSEKRLEEHLEYCQWKTEGYGKWDIPLSEPIISSDEHSSIKFDEQILEKVLQQAKTTTPTMQIGAGNRLLPRTSNRIFSDLTTDERKAVYDYVVSKTIKPNVGEDISNLNKLKEDNSKSSYLELLAHERDLKRRRAKHRGVHTNKKSHIEILREVINQQMEILKEYLNVEKGSDNQNDNVLYNNNKTNCILNTKDICFNENETTVKSNTDTRSLGKKIHNSHHYYQHNNDFNYNHDYYQKNNYVSDNKEKKLQKDNQNEHEYNSKYLYKSSKKHYKNQEHYRSNKPKQSHEKSNKYNLNNEKYDGGPEKYNNKSMRYNKIHEQNKCRKYEDSKYSIKMQHKGKTSTNKRN